MEWEAVCGTAYCVQGWWMVASFFLVTIVQARVAQLRRGGRECAGSYSAIKHGACKRATAIMVQGAACMHAVRTMVTLLKASGHTAQGSTCNDASPAAA